MEPFSEPFELSGARRRGINSVEQGVAVLQAVVELRAAASLKDIARVARLDSSQAHRYISSLVNCGMVRQDPATGLYDLGPTALRTGLAALARLDPIAQIDEAARDLARRCGGTVLLAVWAIGGPTIIRWYHGTPPVYTALTIGSVLPLTASATGKIFLAFLADPLLAPLLKSEGISAPDHDPKLAEERGCVRAAHFATVDNRVIPGLRAMSSPVLGAGERIIAALAIIASDATPPVVDAERAAALLTTCRGLTLDLGGHWGGPSR
ncbi:DNA-binding IclR family transcriptional regulator [Sphingomonas vulcanisoli]|uniref:DNA-binding IclR family transcriptional regulator n=1 Tax=Sphingomonas vulcanisoli TaxID=1658060 RepID=A0ABX0TW74_9SPHN|nr:helix-turn-helix domain-containing protein [Sphingomonas vulcanisoli]NIJ09288.1 DNA-binding IclR family transcriptional regulator [Sphingomonas vulcanisoli]